MPAPSPRSLAVAAGLLLASSASAQSIVSPSGMRAYEVSVAVAPHAAAIAWHGHVSGADRIWVEWLDGAGRPRSAPVPVTDGARNAYEPDLQLVHGAPVVAWYEKGLSDGALSAWLARLDASGHVLWRAPLDGAGGLARNPVVRAGPDGLHVAWLEAPGPKDQPALWTQVFDIIGHPQGPPRRVADASATTWNLNAALVGPDRFLVTYDAFYGSAANELQLVVIGPEGARRLALSPDDRQPSTYPDIAVSASGRAAITWFDRRDGNEEVYLAVLPLRDLLAGAPLPARRITRTTAPSIGAYLAWNGDRLVLAWCDAEPGQDEIYVQLLDADGSPASRPRRLTKTAADSLIPAIRAIGRGFLVGWNEYGPGQGAGHDSEAPSRAMTARIR